MIKTRWMKRTWLFLIVITCSIYIGCGDDPPEPCIGCPVDCDDVSTSQAAALVVAANDSLGRQLYEIINVTLDNPDTTFRPNEVDLSGVQALYTEALNTCGGNSDAKFGVAFTSLMSFATDEDLNNLIDEFKNVYDTMSFNPFEATRLIPLVPLGGSMIPRGMPLKISGISSVLPDVSKLDRAMTYSASNPQISEIQNIIKINLLPKIENAIFYMQDILTDPEYTFVLTPRMQGNTGSDYIIMDKSDFTIILSALYGAKASIHIILSRNLNVDDFTVSAVETAMNQNSSFLSLNSDGVTQMQNAREALLNAEAQAQKAIDYLIAEIGTSQSSDLIKVYEYDIEDLLDIQDSLTHYRSFFGNIKNKEVIFHYRDSVENDSGFNNIWVYDTVIMSVDIDKFFTNPMNNPKLFVPDYVLTIEERVDLYKTYIDDNFSRERYWLFLDTAFGYVTDTPYFEFHLPETNSDEFYELLTAESSRRQFVFGWPGYIYYGGFDSCGIALECYWSQHIDNAVWHYQFYSLQADYFEICYSWAADDFESWTWPNPTFNGLLPGMTHTELKDIIRKLMLDTNNQWKKSDCDIENFD